MELFNRVPVRALYLFRKDRCNWSALKFFLLSLLFISNCVTAQQSQKTSSDPYPIIFIGEGVTIYSADSTFNRTILEHKNISKQVKIVSLQNKKLLKITSAKHSETFSISKNPLLAAVDKKKKEAEIAVKKHIEKIKQASHADIQYRSHIPDTFFTTVTKSAKGIVLPVHEVRTIAVIKTSFWLPKKFPYRKLIPTHKIYHGEVLSPVYYSLLVPRPPPSLI